MSVVLQLGTAEAKLEGASAWLYAGRDRRACQLAHRHPSLSRRHAEIFLKDGQCFIRDLGSANGTWVNGRETAHEAVPLEPGQQVWLGYVPLVVTWLKNNKQTGHTLLGQAMPEKLKAAIEKHSQQVKARTLLGHAMPEQLKAAVELRSEQVKAPSPRPKTPSKRLVKPSR